MIAIDPAFSAGLEQLRSDYRRSLPQQLTRICALWQQALEGENPAEALAALERCAHSLAGSGGTFGYPDMGDAAREVELAVSPLLQTACGLTAAAMAGVSGAIELLRRSLPDEIRIQAGKAAS